MILCRKEILCAKRENGILLKKAVKGESRLNTETNEELKLEQRIKSFANLMMMYGCAIREVKTKLQVLDDEFSVRYKRNPIATIKSRIKKPASIYRKLKKYGLEPMIWSDMFFVTPGGGDYYNVPADYEWPEGEKPDRRTTLVYWDYEGHDPARYTRMARLHKKLTEQVCFAGGAWIWNGLAPNYAQAMDATKAAFAGLKDTGVEDSFFTLWQDNGAETPMVAGFPMMAFYSRCVYGETLDPEEMERWFGMLCGESWQDMLLFDRLDHIPGTGAYNEKFANPSKAVFFQDPLTGVFDAQYAGQGLDVYYKEVGKKIKKAGKRAGAMEKLFRYYRLLAAVAAVKCELGTRLREAYLAEDKETLEEIALQELPALWKKVQKMHKLREEIWQEECKPNGYEVLDVRFAGVEARLKTARRRILDYLDGKTAELTELEEERLPYYKNSAGEAEPVKCNLWEDIVSAANITGV